jgi:cytochrome c peroxidase
VDLRYYGRGRMFWDERAATLEEQVLIPIQNKVEMGQDLTTVVQVLGKDSAYSDLFEKAFGDRKITADRTSKALAQFVRSLVTYRSKYDEGLALAGFPQADFPTFTREENRGKAIFLRRCGVCHFPPSAGVVLSMQDTRNNGLDGDDGVTDSGVADVTGRQRHIGLFKAPSLRNVEYTAPYMHDGRFATLEQVVEHYSSGVKAHPNLDPRLRVTQGVRLSAAQQAALIAFLKTLSDPAFITDPKFSDPFMER